MIAGKILEQVKRIVANLLIASQQTKVGVDSSCARVVVSRANVHVLPQAFGLLPHNHDHLAVRFQSDQAVRNVTTSLLQHVSKPYVSCLIETSLELNEDSDLFPALCGAGQGTNDWTVVIRSVKSGLDGHYRWIRCRHLNKQLGARSKAMKGMMYQNVSLADSLKYLGWLAYVHETRVREPLELWPLEVPVVVDTVDGKLEQLVQAN
mmetsp:Transcript_13167/g.48013  ORF Transcript_13167/g.48013 Transcript_13167/m.48013 type:complete len:207 (-) Transcript_13167:1456-2076(-)